MGNNGSIITHYRPPQLGDGAGLIRAPCYCAECIETNLVIMMRGLGNTEPAFKFWRPQTQGHHRILKSQVTSSMNY